MIWDTVTNTTFGALEQEEGMEEEEGMEGMEEEGMEDEEEEEEEEGMEEEEERFLDSFNAAYRYNSCKSSLPTHMLLVT